MSVSLMVDDFCYFIGRGDFLHSFFSTICYHLENKRWGSRFPCLMEDLYQGELDFEDVDLARKELAQIREELKAFAPNQVIWDIEDLKQRPPWGDDISPDIHNLAEYFITSEGEDIFDEINKAFDNAQAKKADIFIECL